MNDVDVAIAVAEEGAAVVRRGHFQAEGGLDLDGAPGSRRGSGQRMSPTSFLLRSWSMGRCL